MLDWQRELEAALVAADLAGELILRHYGAFARMDWAPGDISTEADKASQERIIAYLLEQFPADGICAEENTAGRRDAPANRNRYWVIDPIDGTRGFALKNGEFAVMIGLVVEGDAILGVVHEPTIARTTFARRGAGCFVRRGQSEPTACHVSTMANLERCVASISRSQSDESARKFRESFGVGRTTAAYSAGIKLAQVARGETDLYLGDYLGLKDWDVCAGHVLVEAAGGAVTTIDATAIAYDGSGRSLKMRGILATNGLVHDAACGILASGRYLPD